jgi:acetyl esterase/lipase
MGCGFWVASGGKLRGRRHPVLRHFRAATVVAVLCAAGCSSSGSGGRDDARDADDARDDVAVDAAEIVGEDGGGEDVVADEGDEGDEGDGAIRPPDPDCTTDGCLREATHVGDYSVAALTPFLDPDVTIDNGYSVYTITYFTSGRDCVGTVAIPYGVEAPAGGFHIVGNEHGTSGVADECAVTGTLSGGGLAGLFGARGFIGVSADYPGLGTSGTHPYLVAESEGRSALDALRATRALALWRAVPVSGRYAVAGLSQGGHATLAAAALHSTYAPELSVRAFAASGPASVWEEQWRLGVAIDGPHQVFHALLVWAWAAGRVDSIMESDCLVSETGGATLGSELGESAATIFSPGFLEAYRTGTWGEYASFHEWFGLNRIGPYAQTAPLKIYQGDADDVVPEAGTAALVAALRAGGVEVDYEVVAGGGHTDVAFGFVAYRQLRTDESIAWLRGQLDAP